MRTVGYDDEENEFRSQDDDDEDDDENDVTAAYLHSGKLQIQKRDQLSGKMAEARQLIFERNSGNIRGKSNLVIESIGDVCCMVVKNAKKIQWRTNQIRKSRGSRHQSTTSQEVIQSQLYLPLYVFRYEPSMCLLSSPW